MQWAGQDIYNLCFRHHMFLFTAHQHRCQTFDLLSSTCMTPPFSSWDISILVPNEFTWAHLEIFFRTFYWSRLKCLTKSLLNISGKLSGLLLTNIQETDVLTELVQGPNPQSWTQLSLIIHVDPTAKSSLFSKALASTCEGYQKPEVSL